MQELRLDIIPANEFCAVISHTEDPDVGTLLHNNAGTHDSNIFYFPTVRGLQCPW